MKDAKHIWLYHRHIWNKLQAAETLNSFKSKTRL